MDHTSLNPLMFSHLVLAGLALAVTAQGKESDECPCGYVDSTTQNLFTETIIVYFNETSTLPVDTFTPQSYTHKVESGWSVLYRQGASPDNVEIGNSSEVSWLESVVNPDSLELFVNPSTYNHLVVGGSIESVRKDIQYATIRASMRGAHPWAGGSALSMLLPYNDSQSIQTDLLNQDGSGSGFVANLLNGEGFAIDRGVNYSAIQDETTRSPYNYMDIKIDWSKTSVNWTVNGNRTRTLSKENATIPEVGFPLVFKHWSNGAAYTGGPPETRSGSNVAYVRAFFNSSIMTTLEHTAFNERCDVSMACSVDDLTLRGSSAFGSLSAVPYVPTAKQVKFRLYAAALTEIMCSVGFIVFVNAIFRRRSPLKSALGLLFVLKDWVKGLFTRKTPAVIEIISDSEKPSPTLAPSIRSEEDVGKGMDSKSSKGVAVSVKTVSGPSTPRRSFDSERTLITSALPTPVPLLQLNDPFNTSMGNPFDTSTSDSFATSMGNPFNTSTSNPFNTSMGAVSRRESVQHAPDAGPSTLARPGMGPLSRRESVDSVQTTASPTTTRRPSQSMGPMSRRESVDSTMSSPSAARPAPPSMGPLSRRESVDSVQTTASPTTPRRSSQSMGPMSRRESVDNVQTVTPPLNVAKTRATRRDSNTVSPITVSIPQVVEPTPSGPSSPTRAMHSRKGSGHSPNISRTPSPLRLAISEADEDDVDETERSPSLNVPISPVRGPSLDIPTSPARVGRGRRSNPSSPIGSRSSSPMVPGVPRTSFESDTTAVSDEPQTPPGSRGGGRHGNSLQPPPSAGEYASRFRRSSKPRLHSAAGLSVSTPTESVIQAQGSEAPTFGSPWGNSGSAPSSPVDDSKPPHSPVRAPRRPSKVRLNSIAAQGAPAEDMLPMTEDQEVVFTSTAWEEEKAGADGEKGAPVRTGIRRLSSGFSSLSRETRGHRDQAWGISMKMPFRRRMSSLGQVFTTSNFATKGVDPEDKHAIRDPVDVVTVPAPQGNDASMTVISKANKRVDYLAGYLAFSSLAVTLVHFALTFLPATVTFARANSHYQSENLARRSIAPFIFSPLWIGPFFTTSTRFLSARYLNGGNLSDMANKTLLRGPRLLIPVLLIATIEYLVIDLGMTNVMQSLPSITYSVWPYVSVYDSFGNFVNDIMELAYMIPNAAPSIVNHFCIGVLWTLPVQLQNSWTVIIGAIMIREIKRPWKRFGFYIFVIVNGWYAYSWSACFWGGLMLSDMQITYKWTSRVQARPWIHYPLVTTLIVLCIASFGSTCLSNNEFFNFDTLEANIHIESTTGRPIGQTSDAGYPDYFYPTLTTLVFALSSHALVELSTVVQKFLSLRFWIRIFPHTMNIYLLHGVIFWTFGGWICIKLSTMGVPYWAVMLVTFVTTYLLMAVLLRIFTPMLNSVSTRACKNIWRWASEEPVEKITTLMPFGKELLEKTPIVEEGQEGES